MLKGDALRIETNLGRNLLDQFDPNAEVLKQDPYDVYDHYRKHDPIHWGKPIDPRLPGTFYLFRYSDNVQLLKFNSGRPPTVGAASTKVWPNIEDELPAEYRPYYGFKQNYLEYQDWPEHPNLRAPIASFFTPARINELWPLVQRLASELIDGVIDRGESEWDLVRDLAYPLPIRVIAELLGVDRADIGMLKSWSTDMLGAHDLRGSINGLGAASTAAINLASYFSALLDARSAKPRDDMISKLARVEDAKSGMGRIYTAAMCATLLVAGHETTQNVLGSGVWGLLQDDRAQYTRLLGDGTGLAAAAAEELLRWASPTQRPARRWAYEDIELGGRTILRGESIQALLGAANHDPSEFPDPAKLDILRENASRNIAFGYGAHFCAGAPLARIEMQAVLTLLPQKMPKLRLDEGAGTTWRDSFVVRGLATLPVRIE